MHISGLKQSRFLTRADVYPEILVTIQQVYQDNVAKEGAPEELKWVISFEETEKPMVLNSTNGQIIARNLGSEETDDWIGHQIVLYDDPNVSFGNKLVGGIRVKSGHASRTAPMQTPQRQPQRPMQRPVQRPAAAAPRPTQRPAPPARPPLQPVQQPQGPVPPQESEIPLDPGVDYPEQGQEPPF